MNNMSVGEEIYLRATVESCRATLQTYEALVGKIQKTVHDFFGKDERWSDFDVLDQGVQLIVKEIESLKQGATWRPISEIHEDFGQCVLMHIDDPCYMRVGNNLDTWFDERSWTHFVPVPSLTTKEAERLRAEMTTHD